MHSSHISEKIGVRKFVKNIIYRVFFYNEFDDDYQGFEEQGVSHEEWKKLRESKENMLKTHELMNQTEIIPAEDSQIMIEK